MPKSEESVFLNEMNKPTKHLISLSDLTDTNIESIYEQAYEFETKQCNFSQSNKKIIANAFFEPSTRTDLSFQAASKRMSHSVLAFYKNKHRSTEKGETDLDSLITLSQYADALIVRHPDSDFIYSAEKVIDIPMINAGNGSEQHPTQALLDGYCMLRSLFPDQKPDLQDLQNLSIGIIGDAKYGRAIHSLIEILRRFKATVHICCPKELYLENPEEGIHFTDDIDSIIAEIDVLYVTRLQKERIPKELVKSISYTYVDADLVQKMKETSIVMHVMPRIDEFSFDIDSDPRAKYFYQMKCGMFVRMALLAYIL